MPSNVFSTIASRAKAHHESLNAAYQATYAPGSTPRTSISTPPTSRKASTTSTSSQQSERNITKAWNAIKKHHQKMNEAYSVFYAPGSVASTRANSAAPSRGASFEEVRHESEAGVEGKPRNYQKVWKSLKNKAVEHHRSVSNASATVYGK
ncbi:hypothetical protein EK21DRAFT_104729 [Setomelanomma holmii]|uniref:Uncharacterized protein n=1 Tax=Setomelanomma holmii TaxID=210430 RepID=A0A9P4H087_9PLEO|nr:hypothetical protein EK21DRAFT_104729 [Setomelanomma holmii]